MDTDQRLTHIEEISKNARATWFSLTAALLFCGVTLLDVEDRDFFEYGAATQLPVIGVEVPVVGFFLSAPVLVLYLYLHVYLVKLWRALAPPFAVGEREALDDRVYPWLLADTALRLRPDMPPRDFGWLSSVVGIALAWAFAPFILGVFWVRSWPYHHEGLTLFLAFLLLVALAMGVGSYLRMRDWMLREGRAPEGCASGFVRFAAPVLGLFGVAVLGIVSWQKTEGPLYPKAFGTLADIHTADLYRLEFVQFPDDWEPRDLAWQSHQRQYRAVVSAEVERDPPEGWVRDENGAFGAEALNTEIETRLKQGFRARRKAAIARLPKEDWQDVDLREADFSGVNMRRAKMEGAVLFGIA